jgi:3-oxoacyl-[acyl-carrier protein] reductase
MAHAAARASRIASHLVASPVAGLSRFAGQVAIITGGARGIGFAAAERFAQEGIQAVAIFDVLDASEAVAKLEGLGAKAMCLKVDLTQPEEVNAAVAKVVAAYGKVDVVVQSAGMTGVTNLKAHEVDPDNFKKIWEVNVFGMFLVCKAVLPRMLESGYGRILNIASISGKDGNPGQLGYASSKAAVIGLTKTMGKDYANIGKDITINSLAPAVVQTAMVEAMPQEQVSMMTSKIPMGRTGKLVEVAATIAYACSPECSFTTGFCFDFSGGRTVY